MIISLYKVEFRIGDVKTGLRDKIAAIPGVDAVRETPGMPNPLYWVTVSFYRDKQLVTMEELYQAIKQLEADSTEVPA